MWDCCCFFAPIIKKYHLSTFCQDPLRNCDLHTCDNTHSQVYYNAAGSQNILTLWCTGCFVSSSAESLLSFTSASASLNLLSLWLRVT